jgi:SAM-dependent methyltransferase
VSCQQIDAESIPFPDKSFDRVTCRFGVMFLPEPVKGLREVCRVLKPGGRAAFTAWAPAELNPFFSAPNGVLRQHGLLTPPPPDAPNVFRFAQEGSLAAAMEEAGFQQVSERQQRIAWRWPGSIDDFWEWFWQGTAFRNAIENAAPERRQTVIDDLRAAFRRFEKAGGLDFGATIVVASGVR